MFYNWFIKWELYTLYIYGLESQSGPVTNDNKVLAVMLTSLEVPVIIPTTTNKAMDIIRSTSTNTPQYTETLVVLSSILTAGLLFLCPHYFPLILLPQLLWKQLLSQLQ